MYTKDFYLGQWETTNEMRNKIIILSKFLVIFFYVELLEIILKCNIKKTLDYFVRETRRPTITNRICRAVQLKRGTLALLEELLMRERRNLRRQRGWRRRRRWWRQREWTLRTALLHDASFALTHFLGAKETLITRYLHLFSLLETVRW